MRGWFNFPFETVLHGTRHMFTGDMTRAREQEAKRPFFTRIMVSSPTGCQTLKGHGCPWNKSMRIWINLADLCLRIIMNLNIKRIQKVISPKETAVLENFFSLIDCQTLGETLTRHHHQKSAAQSSCQVANFTFTSLLLMVQKSDEAITTWDVKKNLVNNGVSTISTVVNAGFLLSTVSMIMVGKKKQPCIWNQLLRIVFDEELVPPVAPQGRVISDGISASVADQSLRLMHAVPWCLTKIAPQTQKIPKWVQKVCDRVIGMSFCAMACAGLGTGSSE